MSLSSKVVAGVAVLIVLIVSAVALSTAGLDSTCVNQIAGQFPSPDRNYQALVFSRDCGATTEFSAQISLLQAGASLTNHPGNLFIASSKGSQEVSSEIRVQWVGDRTLRIEHDVNARVFLANPGVLGVTVIYAPSSRRAG